MRLFQFAFDIPATPVTIQRTMKPTYQIEYSYYQHNDGRANNGNYTETRDYDTREEALAAATRIQAVIEEKASPSEEQAVFDEFHPYSGYFNWVRVYEVTRKEIDVPCPIQS